MPLRDYSRVVPRDLFNESMLLKCLGRVCLLIHEGKAPWLLIRDEDEEDGLPFRVMLDEDNAELVCINLRFSVLGREVAFSTPYNSRLDWPLLYRCDTESDVGIVFTAKGELTSAFMQACASLSGDCEVADASH